MQEQTGARGPLHGVRVVELAGLGPAPFCAMLLSDLGADVVRVDRPGGTPLVGAEQLTDRDLLNRGKRSIVVDLKHERGAETVLALASRASVLLEGFRPGVAERLGVGPADCWERNPALVYGRMTGWGQEGPLAGTAGHDIDYIGLNGVLHAIGRAGGPPQVPVNLLGDFGGGGTYLAIGVLAALLHARASGQGQVVDAAIVDGSAHLSTVLWGLLGLGLWRDERGVNLLDTGMPFYDVHETADGRHMAVGALEPQFYEELLDLLGIADDVPPREDPASIPLLRERMAAAFRSRTQAEWCEVFEGSDACVTPVLSMREATRHPHLAARGTFVEVDGVTQPAPAPRFSATPSPPLRPPAAPGAHSAGVLDDWGVPDAAALLDCGAVVDRSAG